METPVRIEVKPAAIDLVWADGATTRLDASTLRAACPCAACKGAAVPRVVAAGILSARVVGDYALGITFAPDGHATGIFPYDLLRSLGDAA
ncbi:MAG: hypothetical protein A2146_00190 [Actinobacteria bacterium RBG_16_67_10]|nr:MAG: hypothetical protein A2146_00190 [Actinobacteria bacterium RBG_16_67_10]